MPRLHRRRLGVLGAGLLLLATALLIGGRGRIYTVAASEPCLKGLDLRIVGIPTEVDRGSNELTEGASGGTLRVIFREGEDEIDWVALGFYSNAKSADDAIARYRAYTKQFNAGPATDGAFLYRRANVALNWFNPEPTRTAVVEHCLK